MKLAGTGRLWSLEEEKKKTKRTKQKQFAVFPEQTENKNMAVKQTNKQKLEARVPHSAGMQVCACDH